MRIKHIRQIACSLLMLLSINNLSAQRETYNWTFGYGAGMTWNDMRSLTATGVNVSENKILNNLPNNLNSSISTLEGCFTLSNSNGDLLFYSDGVSIWNRDNVIMPNGTGLTGNSSSAQSGIIVPYPGKENMYVAFTLGMTNANNLSYTTIDMSLNSGLGGIVEKNVQLANYTGILGESMTAIKHANDVDYWILAPGRGGANTTMNVWLLSADGISSVPVQSVIPFEVGTNSNGYLKVRPDGKYFVWATFISQSFIYGEFDTNTGMVSNSKQLTGYTNPYGVEFSGNGKLVYLRTNPILYVYKVEDLFNDIINPRTATLTATVSGANVLHGAIQLSPEGRLYMPYNQTNNMFVIEDINDYDNFKVYELANFTDARMGLGLPSFAGSWFSAEASTKSFVCSGNDFRYTIKISFTGSATDHPVRLEWNWGDGTAVETQPISSGQTIYKLPHNYMVAGKYTITITPYKAGNIALTPIRVDTNVIECQLKVNRQIRINLKNAAK